jgi:putative transposase
LNLSAFLISFFVGSIPIKIHREIEGEIKGVIVKREKSGKWFAIVQVEDELKPLQPTGKAVGIDVGIRHFLTDSDGRQIENPKYYERTLNRIKNTTFERMSLLPSILNPD